MENSPFNRLPGELRNHIYELALTRGKSVVLRRTRAGWGVHPDCRGHLCGSLHPGDCPRHLPAFTQTCRAIRRESNLLGFTLNTFELQYTEGFDKIQDILNSFLLQWKILTSRKARSIVMNIGMLPVSRTRQDLHTTCKQLLDLAENLPAATICHPECSVILKIRSATRHRMLEIDVHSLPHPWDTASLLREYRAEVSTWGILEAAKIRWILQNIVRRVSL